MSIAEQIRDQALQLSAEERAWIARDLLESLQAEEVDEAVESTWAEEIEARAEAYAAGELKADDWEVSLQRCRQRLRERRQA
jgi:putative addiction module component (TIGR02574 family)